MFAGVVISFFGVLASLLPEAHVAVLTATSNWVNVPRAVPTLLLSWYGKLNHVAMPTQALLFTMSERVLTSSRFAHFSVFFTTSSEA